MTTETRWGGGGLAASGAQALTRARWLLARRSYDFRVIASLAGPENDVEKPQRSRAELRVARAVPKVGPRSRPGRRRS